MLLFLSRMYLGGKAIVWTLAVGMAGAVYAAPDDAVARAMKLYDQRHYEQASRTLREDLPSLPPAQKSVAHLRLGMIYLKNAALHGQLHRAAIATQIDYLKKLSAVRGKGRSRFVHLYRGETLLEAGRPKAAAKYLQKFIAQARVQPKYKTIARARLGLSYYLRKDSQTAQKLWAGINATDPEVKATLAAVYSRAGLKNKKPLALARAARKKSRGQPSPRMAANLLGVYARAGLTNQGLDLLRRMDLKAASYKEVLGKSKTIHFYDVSLPGHLSMLYQQASLAHLKQAATKPRLKGTADYYLGEAYAYAGNVRRSLRVTDAFLSLGKAPPQYRDRARVRQAAGRYRQGRRSQGLAVWKELATRQPTDPDLLAEILLACIQVKAECKKIIRRAHGVAQTGEGEKYYSLKFALGRYYFMKRDYTKAAFYMEAGRDKSNKNKIEANDPVMLVNLADAYYRTKKFSENLEIYFEMSKHFPVVRQIQEAMQGIYSMEQKSAGDVKIY